MPSMSAGASPASAIAAFEALAASWSSLRLEFLENSVWPMPTTAVWFKGRLMAQDPLATSNNGKVVPSTSRKIA